MLPRIDRSPSIFVDKLSDSAIVVTVRAWVRTENYWDVYYDYNERFYNELPRHGIHFPFPQMDVHVKNAWQSPELHEKIAQIRLKIKKIA